MQFLLAAQFNKIHLGKISQKGETLKGESSFVSRFAQSSAMLIDSVAASTSIILSRPMYQRACKRGMELCSLLTTELRGQRLLFLPNLSTATKQRCKLFPHSTIKSHAKELTKEAKPKEDQLSHYFNHPTNTCLSPSRLWPPPNKADNPSLHNPLLRQERMGCGWLVVIFEWEGVIVEDDPQLEKQAWLFLAQEEGKSPPPAFLLTRIEGMKNEQAISEILCWNRDPSELRRLASRKEEIQQNLHTGFHQIRSGSEEFVNSLMSNGIPIAVASTRPRRTLEEAMQAVGLRNSFDAVVTAADVCRGKPDPEMFVYVAQLLNFIPERCIVVGNSNSSVEAAHDARMKCVAVASKHPFYELGAADLVVRRLDELSVVDLKKLVAVESPQFESEMEFEEDITPALSSVEDHFW